MPVLLLILFIAVPIAEIAIFIQAGERFGLWPTLGLVILTAILGTTLLRYQGLRALHRVQESLNRSEMPIGEVFTGLCLLIAGALLLTPGFLTDGVGFALFIPGIRETIGSGLANLLTSRWAVHVSNDHQSGTPYNGPNKHIIDAEFTELREDPNTDARNTPNRDERKE